MLNARDLCKNIHVLFCYFLVVAFLSGCSNDDKTKVVSDKGNIRSKNGEN